MPEYGFPLNHIFLYKDRIFDYLLIRENTGQRKDVFCHNLRKDVLINILY